MLDKSLPYYGVIMVKTDTNIYPNFPLPEGFTLCGYQPGFEQFWADIMLATQQTDSLAEGLAIFQKDFLSRKDLLATQCLFVLDSAGRAVATASLWHGQHFGAELPRIHWVAVSPEAEGKGLAKALLSRLCEIYNALGYHDFLYLCSQTWSYPAIHLYTTFGFRPYMGEEPINWKTSGESFSIESKKAWDIIKEKISVHPPVLEYPSLNIDLATESHNQHR